LAKKQGGSTMEAHITPAEMPLKAISPEEGVVLIGKAFTRGEVQDYTTCLLDRMTDPIQPRSYRTDADPDDPGRRRLHPILVSGIVCFGLMFVIFFYFSYWK
jgi:hypothetical protein